MLSKLMKYEFKATRRVMLPLLAAILLLSAMSGVSTKILDNPHTGILGNVLSIIVLCAYFGGMAAVFVVALVQMVERFQKNLLGNEGYLMFTLPVSVDAHILSKLIISVIWFAFAGILCTLSIFIMVFVADSSIISEVFRSIPEIGGAINELLYMFGNGNAAVGTIHIAVYVLEVIIVMAVGFASFCLRFYFAMAVGYSFNNHKKLFSVLAFFAIGIVLDIIGTLLLGSSDIFELIYRLGEGVFSNLSWAASAHLMLLFSILSTLIVAAIYYIPTSLFLKKRLNLA